MNLITQTTSVGRLAWEGPGLKLVVAPDPLAADVLSRACANSVAFACGMPAAPDIARCVADLSLFGYPVQIERDAPASQNTTITITHAADTSLWPHQPQPNPAGRLVLSVEQWQMILASAWFLPADGRDAASAAAILAALIPYFVRSAASEDVCAALASRARGDWTLARALERLLWLTPEMPVELGAETHRFVRVEDTNGVIETLLRRSGSAAGAIVLCDDERGLAVQVDGPADAGSLMLACFDLAIVWMAHTRGIGPGLLVHGAGALAGIPEARLLDFLFAADLYCYERRLSYVVVLPAERLPARGLLEAELEARIVWPLTRPRAR